MIFYSLMLNTKCTYLQKELFSKTRLKIYFSGRNRIKGICAFTFLNQYFSIIISCNRDMTLHTYSMPFIKRKQIQRKRRKNSYVVIEQVVISIPFDRFYIKLQFGWKIRSLDMFALVPYFPQDLSLHFILFNSSQIKSGKRSILQYVNFQI